MFESPITQGELDVLDVLQSVLELIQPRFDVLDFEPAPFLPQILESLVVLVVFRFSQDLEVVFIDIDQLQLLVDSGKVLDTLLVLLAYIRRGPRQLSSHVLDSLEVPSL